MCKTKVQPSRGATGTHHTFQPLCVCGFGLLQPVVFRAGLPAPQPLPPALHAPVGALVPHPPAEGDAPEPGLPPHPAPPPAPPPLPPGVGPPQLPLPGAAVLPHPVAAPSCPHPAALGAGAVPFAAGTGSCPPPSPPRVSRSFGSDLSPRMRLASLVCSSVRPCEIVVGPHSLPSMSTRKREKVTRHLHDNLLRAQTSVCLHLEVEFLRFPVVVERLVVARGFFFRCVCA